MVVIAVLTYAVETLESIIRTLKGKPLYWDTRDLQCLVVKRPSIIPHLAAVVSAPCNYVI